MGVPDRGGAGRVRRICSLAHAPVLFTRAGARIFIATSFRGKCAKMRLSLHLAVTRNVRVRCEEVVLGIKYGTSKDLISVSNGTCIL